jgi:hypothetical protein
MKHQIAGFAAVMHSIVGSKFFNERCIVVGTSTDAWLIL